MIFFRRLPTLWWLLAALSVLAACVATPRKKNLIPPADRTLSTEVCETFFDQLHATIDRAGVRDGQTALIPGFPHLRVDRFLASFRYRPLDEEAREAWLVRLQQRAESGFNAEIANLPAGTLNKPATRATVRRCADRLRQRDLADVAQMTKLRKEARMADEYQTWKRFIGLYWLTAWPVKWGYHRFQDETRQRYRIPLADPSTDGQRVVYIPPDEKILSVREVADLLAFSSRNHLNIPEPEGRDRQRLFATFAPVWVVDTWTDADRIGRPGWYPGESIPRVDSRQPVSYRYLSHTRFGGKILLQLNYVVWFPERPLTSATDILGGHLDGLTWRVTLDTDGRPLIHDSMHNCGCFHFFHPGNRLTARPLPPGLSEPAFTPQTAPAWREDERIFLHLSHTSHYLDRLTRGKTPTGTPYRWRPYDDLRSLPVAGSEIRQRKSLFDKDGIVPGTHRGERFILWPMGIADPGAMRQRGRQATAFFDRRHFDDVEIFERYFEAVDVPVLHP